MPSESNPEVRPGHAEVERLAENNAGKAKWHLCEPYVSERQWDTVREDYSPDGTAWDYSLHIEIGT